MAFEILNKYHQPVHSFGSFDHRSDAYRVLRKAIDRLPEAGLHIAPKKEPVPQQ